MEIADKLVAIFLCIAVLVQAVVVRRIVGTWVFPACLFGLFWFLATAVPLVVLFTVPFNPLAMVYIFAACVCFSLTALPFHWREGFAVNARRGPTENLGSPFLVWSFYALSAGASVALVISIAQQGFTLTDILFNFFVVANQYIAKRYSDELTVSIFSQLSFVLMYPAAILGGLAFESARSRFKKTMFVLIVLTPSLLALLVQGAKGNLFLVLFFFWGAILANKLQNGDLSLVRRFNPGKALVYFLIIFVLVIFSFMSRGLYEESDNNIIIHGLIRYFVSYSSAHLFGFSDWFSYFIGGKSTMNYSPNSDTNGFYTFMSAFKLAGSTRTAPPGVYDEYFYYGEFISSNIYTWFRGLITDFGLGGSLVFMFCFGAISHLMYFRGLVARNKAIAISFFIHFIGFLYSTYIISLLMWNSAYTSFFIVAVVLIVNKYISGSPPASKTLNPLSV